MPPRDPKRVAVWALRVAARTAASGVGMKVAAVALPLFIFLLCFGAIFFVPPPSQSGGECQAPSSVKGIPANYMPWLVKAAEKYKLGPRGIFVVAAIHWRESDFGRSTLPGVQPGTENYMGAIGPGQFLKQYWPSFGVDADGDGVKDAYAIPDSIFATARHQSINGAPKDWRKSIFAYNHADWYVQEVLEKADELEKGGGVVAMTTVDCGSPELGASEAKTVERVEEVANWIEAQKLPYCWAGGHAPKPGPSTGSGEFCPPGTEGLDCSGAVRWLLVLSGFDDPGGLRSDFLGGVYPAGIGKAVTIWSNPIHVFIEINGRTWGTSRSNVSNGPGWAPHTTAGFLPSDPLKAL